jgi:hypothetical protein
MGLRLSEHFVNLFKHRKVSSLPALPPPPQKKNFFYMDDVPGHVVPISVPLLGYCVLVSGII